MRLFFSFLDSDGDGLINTSDLQDKLGLDEAHVREMVRVASTAPGKRAVSLDDFVRSLVHRDDHGPSHVRLRACCAPQ